MNIVLFLNFTTFSHRSTSQISKNFNITKLTVIFPVISHVFSDSQAFPDLCGLLSVDRPTAEGSIQVDRSPGDLEDTEQASTTQHRDAEWRHDFRLDEDYFDDGTDHNKEVEAVE